MIIFDMANQESRLSSDLPATRGSTRGVNVIKIPKPLAARVRKVSLDVSANPLAKVLCS